MSKTMSRSNEMAINLLITTRDFNRGNHISKANNFNPVCHGNRVDRWLIDSALARIESLDAR